MKDKPHILLVAGKWILNWAHKRSSKTHHEFPFAEAQDWCWYRNLKEGRV